MAPSICYQWIKGGWRVALHICFALLCIRFLVASMHTSGPMEMVPAGILTVAGIALFLWRPLASLFAFTISIPLLNGLSKTVLAGCPTPSTVIFSAMYLGFFLREILRGTVSLSQRLRGGIARNGAQTAEFVSINEGSLLNSRNAMLVADILITAVLASLIVQIVRHHGTGGFWNTYWSQPEFGFGDRLYFVTSAFVFLQGLFFFRLLGIKGGDIAAWIRPCFVAYALTVALFYTVQRCLNIPDPIDSGRCCAPLEDIHSFGSFAVTLLIFAVSLWQRTTWPKAIFRGLVIAVLLALAILSWSRATWLSGTLVLSIIAWQRLPKKWIVILLSAGVFGIIAMNLNATRASWQHNAYLARLISLVRFENPGSKDPARIYLYDKALAMVKERPFFGFGIGSVYLSSVRYAKPGDPYGNVPNFAHNVVLQMAAELGVPATLVFISLIILAFRCGHLDARQQSKSAEMGSKRPSHAMNDSRPIQTDAGARRVDVGLKNDAGSFRKCSMSSAFPAATGATTSPIFATTLALTTYLLTQATANSLNIYVSNQFFFWLMIAALIWARPTAEL